MKKLLFFITLLILFSCEKQDVDCWVCKVDSITYVGNNIVGTSSVFTYPCNMTPEQIFRHEEDGTGFTDYGLIQTGYAYIHGVTVYTNTKCKRR